MIEAVGLGLIAGLISGLLPAAGNLTTMLLLWSLLTKFGIYDLVLFYMSMASISQYVSSIPAILFGIPGESSSMPTVHESKKLSLEGKIAALKGCATGSFIGTIVTFLFIYALNNNIQSITAKFYNSYTLSILLIFSIVVTAAVSGGKFYVNILLALFGGALTYIGYNQFFASTITFGIPFLSSGLPNIVVIAVLFGFPEIYQSLKYTSAVSNSHLSVRSKKIEFPKVSTSVIGTAAGALGGLIPGLTTVASSSIAYAIGKWRTKSPKELIYYSETANNAGSVSQMLPLLMFGVPILGSEALLMTMMSQKGYSSISTSMVDIFNHMWIAFIVVNVVGLLLSYLVAYYGKISLNVKNITVATSMLLVLSVLYAGYSNNALLTYIGTAALLMPAAYLLRNSNTICLVLGYLTIDTLVESCYRVYYIF